MTKICDRLVPACGFLFGRTYIYIYRFLTALGSKWVGRVGIFSRQAGGHGKKPGEIWYIVDLKVERANTETEKKRMLANGDGL